MRLIDILRPRELRLVPSDQEGFFRLERTSGWLSLSMFERVKAAGITLCTLLVLYGVNLLLFSPPRADPARHLGVLALIGVLSVILARLLQKWQLKEIGFRDDRLVALYGTGKGTATQKSAASLKWLDYGIRHRITMVFHGEKLPSGAEINMFFAFGGSPRLSVPTGLSKEEARKLFKMLKAWAGHGEYIEKPEVRSGLATAFAVGLGLLVSLAIIPFSWKFEGGLINVGKEFALQLFAGGIIAGLSVGSLRQAFGRVEQIGREDSTEKPADSGCDVVDADEQANEAE